MKTEKEPVKPSFHQRFVELQSKVRVTKDQFNSFGKYAYWTVGDILAEARPIANSLGLSVVISDDVQLIGERFYIVATVTIADNESGQSVSNKAFAREADTKPGMDVAQVTGSASSYARKYALAGLLGLDGEKDSDATNTHEKKPSPASHTPSERKGPDLDKPASDKQKGLVRALIKQMDVKTVSDEQVNTLTGKQASAWIEKLNKMKDQKQAPAPEIKSDDIPW